VPAVFEHCVTGSGSQTARSPSNPALKDLPRTPTHDEGQFFRADDSCLRPQTDDSLVLEHKDTQELLVETPFLDQEDSLHDSKYNHAS
jgi:hypothetical protein